jgi:5-methylcytosine-specific restriction endonuclease McrA
MMPRDERPEAVAAEHPARLTESRYVPRKVLREVFARDGGQCTFISPEGRRCSSREFLEVHHHEPFARGGKATVDNLRLSCRAHNQFLAELDYGRGFMLEKRSEAERASHRCAAAS